MGWPSAGWQSSGNGSPVRTHWRSQPSSHGRALRRPGDRVDELFEERLVEIVAGKRLDRLRNKIRRQLIESHTNDIHTGADMDQRNLGALARCDADGGVQRDRVPDDFPPLRIETVILQEGIGRISSDDFESLCASEFGREPQVVQDSREKEELLVVAQVLRLPDQGAENEVLTTCVHTTGGETR
jgi:hypothetical protein